jgi:hypothetical protein
MAPQLSDRGGEGNPIRACSPRDVCDGYRGFGHQFNITMMQDGVSSPIQPDGHSEVCRTPVQLVVIAGLSRLPTRGHKSMQLRGSHTSNELIGAQTLASDLACNRRTIHEYFKFTL